MRIFVTVAVASVLGVFVQPVLADELPLGTWNGFGVRVNGAANQNRQAAALIVKRVPDPHVLWRGGSGELTSVVFQIGNANNPNGQREASSVSFGDGRLVFGFANADTGDTVTCALTRDAKEGTYVGDCLGGYDRRLTLTPPPPAPPKPAEQKPAEAK